MGNQPCCNKEQEHKDEVVVNLNLQNRKSTVKSNYYMFNKTAESKYSRNTSPWMKLNSTGTPLECDRFADTNDHTLSL